MPFKINISNKEGKTFKLELDSESLVGKELHEKVTGNLILPDLEGYEFEITGASDKSGFTAMEGVEGIGLKKVLLTYGKGMKKNPRKEGKKKVTRNKPMGLKLRKTVRGKVISPAISQINLKITKEGSKKLAEVFPDQNVEEKGSEEVEGAKKVEGGIQQGGTLPEEKAAEETKEEKIVEADASKDVKDNKEKSTDETTDKVEPSVSEKDESLSKEKITEPQSGEAKSPEQ